MNDIRYFAALVLTISLLGLNTSALPETENVNGNIYAPGGSEVFQNNENSYYSGYDSSLNDRYGSYSEDYGSSNNMDYSNSNSQDQSYYDYSSQPNREVTLTLYVLEKNGDGTALPGVTVVSYDAAGRLFQGETDENGFVIINGRAGLWQFAIGMEGYKTLSLAFNVTQTSAAIATIERIDRAVQANIEADKLDGSGEVASREVASDRSVEPAVLTVYVHEGSLNGTLLGGVFIEGLDAAGEKFMGYTGSSGVTALEGMPGTWQFSFSKEGYDTLRLNYNVTESGEGAVYLQKTAQPQGATQPQEAAQSQEVAQPQEATQLQDQVAITVHIHEDNLDGTKLSNVLIFGQDGAEESFSEVTNSEGMATIIGVPGTWQFVFSKEGYEILHISYNVTKTQEAAAYLKREQQEAQFSMMPPSK